MAGSKSGVLSLSINHLSWDPRLPRRPSPVRRIAYRPPPGANAAHAGHRVARLRRRPLPRGEALAQVGEDRAVGREPIPGNAGD